jgi:hypothetical protein
MLETKHQKVCVCVCVYGYVKQFKCEIRGNEVTKIGYDGWICTVNTLSQFLEIFIGISNLSK